MNAQTTEAIEIARRGGLDEVQVPRLQVRLMAEMAEQLAALAEGGVGGAKLVTVADDAALAALTSSDVNVGDLVGITNSPSNPNLSSGAVFLLFHGTNPSNIEHYAQIPNYFFAGDWLTNFFTSQGNPNFGTVTANDLNTTGDVTAGGNVGGTYVSGMDLSAGNTITSTGDITSIAGNIYVSLGGIVAYSTIKSDYGNIEATSGNVIAGLDVQGSNLIATNDVTAVNQVAGQTGVFATLSATALLQWPEYFIVMLPAPTGPSQFCCVVDSSLAYGSISRGSIGTGLVDGGTETIPLYSCWDGISDYRWMTF